MHRKLFFILVDAYRESIGHPSKALVRHFKRIAQEERKGRSRFSQGNKNFRQALNKLRAQNLVIENAEKTLNQARELIILEIEKQDTSSANY